MASQILEETSDVEVIATATIFDAPDYDNLPKLGNNCTKSTFANMGNFIMDKMATITILKPVQEGSSPNTWAELVTTQSCNNESMWFCAMTMTEYNATVDQETQCLTSLDGSFRQSKGWSQLILHGTTMDAVCNLAYHASMGHTILDEDNTGFILVGITVDMFNWSSRSSYKLVKNFERGHSVQYCQVLTGDKYYLSQFEKNNLLASKVTQYDATQVFDRYTYDKGYVWVYGAPINVLKALAADERNAIHAAFQQAMTHAGSQGLAQLPPVVYSALQGYKRITNFAEGQSTIEGKANRGHPEHRQWVLSHQVVLRQQEEAMKLAIEQAKKEEEDNVRAAKRTREETDP